MRSFLRSMIGLALTLALGLGTGALSLSVADSAAVPAAPLASPPTTGSFAALAEAVKPAVINVSTEGGRRGRPRAEEFFGGEGPQRRPRRGVGSGVVIDPSGVALTNAHVVDSGGRIEVTLLDGTTYPAKVVGTDKKTDLAVIRLQATGKTFPYLPLGDSDAVKVGDWVLAVGSPFGLNATVTSGIVSAKARQIGAGPYDDFLQTDAAINPGNSGGPLVNMRGEVIGINTAIVRGGSGIGFAIPANLAKRISADLVANGSVARGWLGVTLQPLTPDLAASFGVKDRKGVLISEVTPESPAARGGLKAGDVVLQMNATKVESPGDLARAVGLAKPGTETTLRVWRNGAEHTVKVTLAHGPGEAARAARG
ncbi:MAG TPA: trypsin-like peptidase domain-containing protein [Methylomirabilota bacterium]|nr:trypsin-like peptidase domain-containing protein [Methylomirabilota bacterium]